MKKLQIPKYFEIYETGKRTTHYPEEFVKDIVYCDKIFTVFFSEDKKNWFKSFPSVICVYEEFNNDYNSNLKNLCKP